MTKKIIFYLIICISLSFSKDIKATNPFKKEEMFSQKYTYKTLSTYQKQLFDDFVEEQMPKGSALKLDENTGTRGIMRLACALFYRNKAGDVENAVKIIKWILHFKIWTKRAKIMQFGEEMASRAKTTTKICVSLSVLI